MKRYSMCCGSITETDGIDEEEKAIHYLMDNIPKKCIEMVWDKIQKEDYMWFSLQHFDFGMYVRNTLRKGGFELVFFDLDDAWVPLIEEAARRLMG